MGMRLAGLWNGAPHLYKTVHHATVNFQIHSDAFKPQAIGISQPFIHQRIAFRQTDPGRRHAFQFGRDQGRDGRLGRREGLGPAVQAATEAAASWLARSIDMLRSVRTAWAEAAPANAVSAARASRDFFIATIS